MVKQIAHICIHSPDLNKSKHFYCDTLGLSVAFDYEKDGQPFGFYIAMGNGTYVEIFRGEPKGPGTIDHLAIEVEGIDDVVEAVRAAGYDVSEKRLGRDGTWQAWTADPSGMKIEFHEYTEQSLQRTGGTAVADW